MKKRVLAGAVAGIAVAGAGAAVAANQLGSPQQRSQAIVNDAAKQLGVTPSALSGALKKALENQVDAAVAAGRLTKAQGDELKQHIESGDFPIFGGPGRDGDGPGFHHGFGGLDAAASYLGLTQAELRTRLENGNTLAAIAKAQGKSVSGLVDAMYSAAKTHLDADVKAGRLSASDETRMLSGLKDRLTSFVNGARPAFDHDGDGPPPGAPPAGARFAPVPAQPGI